MRSKLRIYYSVCSYEKVKKRGGGEITKTFCSREFSMIKALRCDLLVNYNRGCKKKKLDVKKSNIINYKALI